MLDQAYRWFLRRSVLALLPGLASILAACGGGSESSEAILSLGVRTEVTDIAYRLSNSTFEITGEGMAPVTLSTADSPNAAALQEALPAGRYTIELREGWVLEREVASGFEAIAGAMLTSDNPLSVSLTPSRLTRAGFAFTAAGVDVDFQANGGDPDEFYD